MRLLKEEKTRGAEMAQEFGCDGIFCLWCCVKTTAFALHFTFRRANLRWRYLLAHPFSEHGVVGRTYPPSSSSSLICTTFQHDSTI